MTKPQIQNMLQKEGISEITVRRGNDGDGRESTMRYEVNNFKHGCPTLEEVRRYSLSHTHTRARTTGICLSICSRTHLAYVIRVSCPQVRVAAADALKKKDPRALMPTWQQILAAVGWTWFFSPPYSPQFCCIEKFWAVGKNAVASARSQSRGRTSADVADILNRMWTDEAAHGCVDTQNEKFRPSSLENEVPGGTVLAFFRGRIT